MFWVLKGFVQNMSSRCTSSPVGKIKTFFACLGENWPLKLQQNHKICGLQMCRWVFSIGSSLYSFCMGIYSDFISNLLHKPYDSPSSTLLLLDIFSLGSPNHLQNFFPLSNTALWFATLAFRTIFSNPLICNLHSVQCRKHVSLLSPLMTFQLMQFCMGKYVCIQVFFTVPNRILQRIHT